MHLEAGTRSVGLLHDAAVAGKLLWPAQDVTLPLIKVTCHPVCREDRQEEVADGSDMCTRF